MTLYRRNFVKKLWS